MWINKKIIVPVEAFVKVISKAKSIDGQIPTDAVNLSGRESNGQIVIEWKERSDEQQEQINSGSDNSGDKLPDTSSSDGKE
jgi:hypothetical protein|tara:strand:+ start:303 stop:545 length:243 start_codon:yes stop_codon:yes gene_type:complete